MSTIKIENLVHRSGTGGNAVVLNSNGGVTYGKQQIATVSSVTYGATTTLDLQTANNFTITLTGNVTFADPSNETAGQSGSIFIVQDGTGNRTAAWNGAWKFPAGTDPTLSTAANAVDRVDYIVRGAGDIHAVWSGALA